MIPFLIWYNKSLNLIFVFFFWKFSVKFCCLIRLFVYFLFVCRMEIILEEKDAGDWSYRGEGAVNLVLAYTGSSPTFVWYFYPLLIFALFIVACYFNWLILSLYSIHFSISCFIWVNFFQFWASSKLESSFMFSSRWWCNLYSIFSKISVLLTLEI